jgi:hypothetical protein
LAVADAETRARLQVVLRAINYADTDHPTPVTLHVKDALPKDVLAALASQADTEIITEPANLLNDLKDRITLDADHQPFWVVALEVCRRTHLTPVQSGGIGQRTITLKKGEEPKPLALPSQNGCFHITPTTATSGGTVANRTILAFRMLVDPKLTVLRSTTFIATARAADVAGNSLLYNAPFSSDEFTTYYNWHWGLTSHILTPADGNVANFKGTVRSQVLQETTQFEADPSDARTYSREVPFGRAALADLAKVDTRNARILVLYPVYGLKASIDIAPGAEFMVGGSTVFGGTVRLRDEAGQVSAPTYFGTAKTTGGHAEFSTTIPARTPEGKNLGNITGIQWDIPARVREITVPVEFTNIAIR